MAVREKTMKKYRNYNILLLHVCAVALALGIVSGCGTTPLQEKRGEFNFRIFPSNMEIENGKESMASVWVDEADKLIAVRLKISFDPSFVEISSVSTSGANFMFSDAGADVVEIENHIDATKGVITIGISAHKDAFQGVSGSGQIVLFGVKAKKVGQTSLQFVNINPDDIVSAVYSTKSKTGWEENQVATFNGVVVIKEPQNVANTSKE